MSGDVITKSLNSFGGCHLKINEDSNSISTCVINPDRRMPLGNAIGANLRASLYRLAEILSTKISRILNHDDEAVVR